MSFENVVLTYQHPHVAVYVEDNTEYVEDTVVEEDRSPNLIQCGTFGQGRDNQVIYCKTIDEFISEFGKPNFKLYGQAGYNIARALSTGNAGAYVLRVMPEDATFANAIIMIKYKVAEAEDNSKYLSVAYTAQSVENVKKLVQLKNQMTSLSANNDPDENGYYTKPLLAVYSIGRGAYGNNYRFRIADTTDYEDDYNSTREFRFDVITMEGTLVRKEYAYGTFNFDAVDDYTGDSLYLEEIINDTENGLGKLNIIFNTDLYEDLITLYNTEVIDSDDTEATSTTFDIFYGRTITGEVNPYINIETLTDQISFTSESDGIILSGGSDGALAITNADRDTVVKELLVDAYSGTLDKAILSPYATPATFMLDANFPEDVKRAMAALAMRRQYDATCYLDSNTLDSISDICYYWKHMSDIADPNVLKELHHYTYRDREYTGKSIEVTSTFFLAGLIPNHFNEYGFNVPMALGYARLTDAVAGSFSPVIDPDDHDIKKELYKLRVNYYESVSRNVYQRGLAMNSQKILSDRSDEFNNYILNEAVAVAKSVMQNHIYNFGEAEDRAEYQTKTNDLMQERIGQYVRSCTVEYKQSTEDERKSILRLVLRIVYKTVIKRGIVEIYLDPRTSSTTTATEEDSE